MILKMEARKQVKAEAELRQLAVDYYDGKVFSDRHIPEHEKHLISAVFMPLALGALSEYDQETTKQISMLYEYIDQAGPRGINGMPIFGSVRILWADEAEKMLKYFEEYKAIKEQFLNSANEKQETRSDPGAA
jgi:hypothetical protein